MVSGCKSDNSDTSPSAIDPAESFVALYANSSYDDGDLHGTVILIDEQGRTTLRETQGMYGGELGWANGALHFSDLDSEFRWEADGKITERRRPLSDPLQDWSGAVGDEFVAVFNSGLDGDGRYAYNVSIWSAAGLTTSAIYGTLWGVTECDGQLLALVEDDAVSTGDVRLLTLSVKGSNIVTNEIGRIDMPARGSEYSAFGCAGSTPTVMAETRREVFIGQISESNDSWIWRLTDVEVGDYPKKFTQIGDEFVAIDAENGEVVALKMNATSSEDYGSLPEADAYRYSSGVRGEFVVMSQDRSTVRVTVFDHPGGQVLHETSVSGLGEILSGRNEILTGSPALNPAWTSEVAQD